MLHRLWAVLVRLGRDRLSGTVEGDEAYIGGEIPGRRGGRQEGKKALVGEAVEVLEPRAGTAGAGWRSCPRGSAASLPTFVTDHVEPGRMGCWSWHVGTTTRRGRDASRGRVEAIELPGGSSDPSRSGYVGCGAQAPHASTGSPGYERLLPPSGYRAPRSRRNVRAPRWPATGLAREWADAGVA